MNRFESFNGGTADKAINPLMWFMALMLTVFVAGCGGGQGAILGGTGAALAPTVTSVAPVNNAFGVGVNNTIITANFSEPMAPITGGATFTVTCALPCINPVPLVPVSLDATNRIATFTSTAALSYTTLYTATITAAKSLATGLALTSPYVWQFTTGLAPDITRPKVSATFPLDTASGVPANTAVTATFDKNMNPLTINSASSVVGSFTLACAASCVTPSPSGDVNYNVGSKIATFTPTAVLEVGKTYTATIKGTGGSPATDTVVPGNALAGITAAPLAANDHVWTFTTGVPVPPVPVTVVSTKPLNGAVLVCPSVNISATFSVPMNPGVTTANFFLTGPGVTPVLGSTLLDGTGKIATFTPSAPLTNTVVYTVTIKGDPTSIGAGVKDLAIPANTMTSGDKVWSFTAGPATGLCLPPVVLGRASTFGIAATAGVTDTPTAPVTHIEGDVVLSNPSPTCNAVAAAGGAGTPGFGLCGSNGSTPTLNGTVVTPTIPDTTTATNVVTDLRAAFLSITPPAGPPAAGGLAGGVVIGAPSAALGGGVGGICVPNVNCFTPGVYTAASTIVITGDLTLDALGNPDAVFVFQAGSTLGTADGAVPPAGIRTRILLVGGAKASNIFWQVGTSATLGLYSEFVGNILSSASITMKTGATSCGRLFAGAFTAGAFVFDTNIVSVPGQPFAPPATYSAVCQ